MVVTTVVCVAGAKENCPRRAFCKRLLCVCVELAEVSSWKGSLSVLCELVESADSADAGGEYAFGCGGALVSIITTPESSSMLSEVLSVVKWEVYCGARLVVDTRVTRDGNAFQPRKRVELHLSRSGILSLPRYLKTMHTRSLQETAARGKRDRKGKQRPMTNPDASVARRTRRGTGFEACDLAEDRERARAKIVRVQERRRRCRDDRTGDEMSRDSSPTSDSKMVRDERRGFWVEMCGGRSAGSLPVWPKRRQGLETTEFPGWPFPDANSRFPLWLTRNLQIKRSQPMTPCHYMIFASFGLSRA